MILFLLLVPLMVFGSSEELIELQLAGLTAERIHLQNVLLVGVDPVTCKNTESSSLMVRQMENISKSGLSHCMQAIQQQLKTIDDRMKKLEEGHLSFSPLKNEPVFLPVESSQEVSLAAPMPDSSPEEETNWPVLGPVPDREISPEAQSKHQMMVDFYSANKTMFEPKEDDSIFERVSKGYIRNLHNMEPGN